MNMLETEEYCSNNDLQPKNSSLLYYKLCSGTITININLKLTLKAEISMIRN